MKHLADFFIFARERESIRKRREAGESPPWTDDPVLRRVRFCNVRREDDKVTRWFHEHIRGPLAEIPYRSVLACTAFRFFNNIPTGEVLAPFLIRGQWPSKEELCRLLAPLPRVVGGAYLIKSPPGQRKAAGLWDVIEPVALKADALALDMHLGGTLEKAHELLMGYPYLGRFMAYEVVTDLRHTCVLREAKDIHTWASAGPGAARGLGWVKSGDPSTFSYGSARQQEGMLDLMRTLLDHAPPSWEIREVEHVLCEFDKYQRARAGQRPKRWFR